MVFICITHNTSWWTDGLCLINSWESHAGADVLLHDFNALHGIHSEGYSCRGEAFALPLPSPLPRPLNAQYRQVTKAKMANKFLQSWRSFGSSFCRGMQHFHGVKVQRWKALTRYTACRYMSSIVDRKSLKINKSFNHVVTMPALFHTSS